MLRFAASSKRCSHWNDPVQTTFHPRLRRIDPASLRLAHSLNLPQGHAPCGGRVFVGIPLWELP